MVKESDIIVIIVIDPRIVKDELSMLRSFGMVILIYRINWMLWIYVCVCVSNIEFSFSNEEVRSLFSTP